MAAAVVPRRTAKVLVCSALSGLVIYLYFSIRTPYSTKYPNFSANFLDREFQYSLDPPDVGFCGQIGDNITVVALIITAPANFEKRNDARNTWMYDKENPADIQVRFIVGRTTNASLEAEIAEEQRKYKDILRYNYLDTYDLLPIKVHAAFNFFQTFCPSVKYFLKIDDDVVADLDRLSYHINNSFDHIERRDFFACFVWAKPPVIRHKTSRFYVSEAEYPDKKYPHVCSGPAYLMTNEAVSKILKTIPSLKFFKFEDILISGTARQKSNIQLISSNVVDGNSATHPIRVAFCDFNGVPLPATMRFATPVTNVSAAYQEFKSLTCNRTLSRPNKLIFA